MKCVTTALFVSQNLLSPALCPLFTSNVLCLPAMVPYFNQTCSQLTNWCSTTITPIQSKTPDHLLPLLSTRWQAHQHLSPMGIEQARQDGGAYRLVPKRRLWSRRPPWATVEPEIECFIYLKATDTEQQMITFEQTRDTMILMPLGKNFLPL